MLSGREAMAADGEAGWGGGGRGSSSRVGGGVRRWEGWGGQKDG